MNDLISREAALAICQKEYEERLQMADYCGDTVAWNIGGAIKALPAVDAVLVVRCRECKRCDGFPGPDIDQNEVGICKNTMMTVKPNDYCSYGVKMDLPEGEEEQNYD